MFHILGFLFIIIIAVLIIGLSLIGSIFRALFGFGKRPASRQANRAASANQSKEENHSSPNEEVSPQHKKIFSKDDGEYVDFEEIK